MPPLSPRAARRTITVQQLAARLGVNERTVGRFIAAGKVDAERVEMPRIRPRACYGGRPRYRWAIDAESARQFARTYVYHQGSGCRR